METGLHQGPAAPEATERAKDLDANFSNAAYVISWK